MQFKNTKKYYNVCTRVIKCHVKKKLMLIKLILLQTVCDVLPWHRLYAKKIETKI